MDKGNFTIWWIRWLIDVAFGDKSSLSFKLIRWPRCVDKLIARQQPTYLFSVDCNRSEWKELEMGSRNRAFYEDDEPSPTSRNSRDEIPSISKHTHTDGAQFTKYVRISVNNHLKFTIVLWLQAEKISGLNLNDYATRKTIAQGMLDLALLTANAAQLKRIMTIGNAHRFYYLLMVLITISICLQVVCTF